MHLKLLTHKASKGVGVILWDGSKVIVERSIMSLARDGTAPRDVSPEVIDSSPARSKHAYARAASASSSRYWRQHNYYCTE